MFTAKNAGKGQWSDIIGWVLLAIYFWNLREIRIIRVIRYVLGSVEVPDRWKQIGAGTNISCNGRYGNNTLYCRAKSSALGLELAKHSALDRGYNKNFG